MKKILIILGLIFNSNLYCQWVLQYPVTPFNHLYDVKFINDKTGWACGNMGTIMHTTTGGKEWIRQNSQVPSEILKKIFPIDSEVVYCVGYFETILKTTDGGNNWIVIRHSPSQAPSYQALFFLNRDTGWLVKNQYVLRTIDGCKSFDSTFVPQSFIYDIYFRNINDGLFCGQSAAMYRTIDGGASWTNIIIVPKGQGLGDFNTMTFINADTGFTQGVQTNIVFKTTNFGISWDSITQIVGPDESYAIFFSSINIGWSAGAYGRMFNSTDGGYHWAQQNLSQFNEAFIHSLSFYNDSIGWAVGAATKILHTENGGKTIITNYTQDFINTFNLYQNYPNPFNNSTVFSYSIQKADFYKLEIFNTLGQRVYVLLDEFKTAGYYEIKFNADDFASGVYYYILKDSKLTITKKFLLMK